MIRLSLHAAAVGVASRLLHIMDQSDFDVTTLAPIDLELLQKEFRWPDYLVFALLLAISAGIGIFYGFFRKQESAEEFLMAGRSMGTFPMAMSLIAR